MVDKALFEIQAHLGALKEYGNGWRKELNIVSWNGAEPKFDIRDWDPEYQQMTRGITLTEVEAMKLCIMLMKVFMKEAEDEEC